MLRAVLFDFDGVIVDTEPLHLAAMNEVLAQDGIAEVSWQEYCEQMLGLSDRELFTTSYARAGLSLDPGRLSELIAEKSRRFLDRAQRDSIVLRGAAELIESLSPRYPLAICSGALRREIELILDGAGLLRHFAVIVSAEDVQRGKPDPQGYLLAMRRVQEAAGCEPALQPCECLVVEDSCPGIEAAKEAGMVCLAVSTSVQGELLLQADAIVGSLHEVDPGLLGALFEG